MVDVSKKIIFLGIIGVWVSLHSSRLISWDPQINDQVNFFKKDYIFNLLIMVIRSFLNNYDELKLHYLCELDTKSQSKRFLFGMVSKLYLRLVIALMCFCSHCCISCYQIIILTTNCMVVLGLCASLSRR
jgi:hypothetical protein